VYSVRPHVAAAVSAPVTWEEIEEGIQIEDFTLRTVPDRIAAVGDLWAPLLAERGRAKLERFLQTD
jgi:bifunctional non-homologous end joining protein LigD